MTAPARKAPLTHIGGADLKRFVVHSALLRLIDPVRGPPTRTSLDENPDADVPGGQQLKHRFLDSFALICSTSSSGAETASAVCLEQHAPDGAVLRVARNRGLAPEDLAGLERVLQVLKEVASKEKSSAQAEPEILRLVVELDRGRILAIADKVENGIRDFLREARSGLLAGRGRPETGPRPGLRTWLEGCPFTAAASPRSWSHATTAALITWASQARWLYPKQLQSLLGAQKPPWLDSLHKLARYHSAIKSMTKLAAKQPELFAGIHIIELQAPALRPFSLLNDKAPLLAAVRSLVKEDPGATMEQLEEHLGTPDVEGRLRKACRQSLTLHAEMQLVVFYEGSPGSAPRLPFIGTSKKACFLCHEYLLQHPLGLRVSACHQKIYPSWMPPPYYPVLRQFKSAPFARLGRRIEQLARQELKTALNAPQRPRNQDSTAGPSLTITATGSIGLGSRRAAEIQSTPKDAGL